jgi:hypothetical protein
MVIFDVEKALLRPMGAMVLTIVEVNLVACLGPTPFKTHSNLPSLVVICASEEVPADSPVDAPGPAKPEESTSEGANDDSSFPSIRSMFQKQDLRREILSHR